MLTQIYNEAIDIKNQMGDPTLLKKFRTLIRNIAKEEKNTEIV